MRVIASILLFSLLLSVSPAQSKGRGRARDDSPADVQLIVVAGGGGSPAVAGVRVSSRDATDGADSVDGSRTNGIRAQHTCLSPVSISPTANALPDEFTFRNGIDPITGFAYTEQIFLRRSVSLSVECAGRTYRVIRCVVGDCPVATEVLPDLQLLIAMARKTAHYEIPVPLFSPAIRPGKAPVPGLPFYFAVSQAQWDRVVDAHALACNGVLCAYAHVTGHVVGLKFDSGDGETIVCTTSGVVVRSEAQFRSVPRDCSYVYQTGERFSGSLTLMYAVTVTAGANVLGVDQAPSIGPINSRVDVSQLVTIPVTEYQPVIIK